MPKKSGKNDFYKTVEMFDGGQKFELEYEFVEIARLRAKECGESLPGLFKRCLEVGVGFKPETWQGLTTLADLFGMSESQIVNVLLMRAMAESEAQREVYGDDAPDLFEDAFMWDGDGPITGETLFENFKRDFTGELRQKRIREIGERLAQAGNRVDLLPETDREFYQEYLDSIKNVKARAPKGKKPRRMATRNDE
jgi:hypothetical protein